MNKAQVIPYFWNQFQWPAYDENTVPDNAKAPIITFNNIISKFEDNVMLNADLWYRSKSWETIEEKAAEIAEAIGYRWDCDIDNGKVHIYQGSPFSQHMPDDDDSMRRIRINIIVNYDTAI